MERTELDVAALYAALDAARRARGLSWRELALACTISPSSLTRMGQGKRPDVNTLAALVTWLKVPVERFIRVANEAPKATRQKADTVAMITAALRADRELTTRDAQYIQDALLAAYSFVRNSKQKN